MWGFPHGPHESDVWFGPRELKPRSRCPEGGREDLPLLQRVLRLIPPSPAEIAPHIRLGRQEDAHEFLRFTIDAMQKACLPDCTEYVGPLVAVTALVCWSPVPAGGDCGVNVSPGLGSWREVLTPGSGVDGPALCPSVTQPWAAVCLLLTPPPQHSCGSVPKSCDWAGFGS